MGGNQESDQRRKRERFQSGAGQSDALLAAESNPGPSQNDRFFNDVFASSKSRHEFYP